MKISEEAKREYINEGTVARAVRGKLGWLDEGFGLGQVGCRTLWCKAWPSDFNSAAVFSR